MVDYGEHFDDEAPTSTHIKRQERKYRFHKLSQAVSNLRFHRNHPDHQIQSNNKNK